MGTKDWVIFVFSTIHGVWVSSKIWSRIFLCVNPMSRLTSWLLVSSTATWSNSKMNIRNSWSQALQIANRSMIMVWTRLVMAPSYKITRRLSERPSNCLGETCCKKEPHFLYELNFSFHVVLSRLRQQLHHDLQCKAFPWPCVDS